MLEAAVDADSASAIDKALVDQAIDNGMLPALVVRAVRGGKYGAWRALTDSGAMYLELPTCMHYVHEVARTKDCPAVVVENVCTIIGCAFDSGSFTLAAILELVAKLASMAAENANANGVRLFNSLYLHYLRISQTVAKQSTDEFVRPPKKRRVERFKQAIESSSDTEDDAKRNRAVQEKKSDDSGSSSDDSESSSGSEDSSQRLDAHKRVSDDKASKQRLAKQHMATLHQKIIGEVFVYRANTRMSSTNARRALNKALQARGISPLLSSWKFKTYVTQCFGEAAVVALAAGRGSAYNLAVAAAMKK